MIRTHLIFLLLCIISSLCVNIDINSNININIATGNVTYMTTAVLGGVIPLSGSLVIVANTSSNTIDLFDISSGATLTQVEVNGTPEQIVLDPQDGGVFVSFSSGILARVYPLLSKVEYIPLPASSVTIAVTSKYLYVMTTDNVLVMDKASYSVVSSASLLYLTNTFVASSDDDFIIACGLGYSSGGYLCNKFTLDKNGSSWNMTQSGVHAENGNTLVLSPDNQRLEFVSGGGNEKSYVTTDYSTADLTHINGYFSQGAYPTGGAYTPNQKYFLTSNRDYLQVFDATRYNLVEQQTITAGDPYFSLVGVYSSVDNARVFGYGTTGFNADGGLLFWFDI